MNEYKFLKFDGVYPRGDERIAINKSGLIRLSPGFRRITKIISYKFAVLFYDSDRRAIAFKFTNAKEAGVLRVTKDKTGATISGTSFMKANKLNPANCHGRYDWKKLVIPDIGEVFIIDLDKK